MQFESRFECARDALAAEDAVEGYYRFGLTGVAQSGFQRIAMGKCKTWDRQPAQKGASRGARATDNLPVHNLERRSAQLWGRAVVPKCGRSGNLLSARRGSVQHAYELMLHPDRNTSRHTMW